MYTEIVYIYIQKRRHYKKYTYLFYYFFTQVVNARKKALLLVAPVEYTASTFSNNIHYHYRESRCKDENFPYTMYVTCIEQRVGLFTEFSAVCNTLYPIPVSSFQLT